MAAVPAHDTETAVVLLREHRENALPSLRRSLNTDGLRTDSTSGD
jgi:hypothetical protein